MILVYSSCLKMILHIKYGIQSQLVWHLYIEYQIEDVNQVRLQRKQEFVTVDHNSDQFGQGSVIKDKEVTPHS